jgi:hypothetical protein
MSITVVRPRLAATGPANHAPTAQPISETAATKPTAAELRPSVDRMPTIAEFIVDVSNPKRKPPSAAPAATSVT